jgi:hypothetical protein
MDENQRNDNGSNNTVDYSQLYGENTAPTNSETIISPVVPVVEETPIILDEPKEVKEIVEDVIPAFDTSVLEELPDDLKPDVPEEPLINTMIKESEEKEQHKRNIIFIAILFAVLIFAVVVLFPMLIDI